MDLNTYLRIIVGSSCVALIAGCGTSGDSAAGDSTAGFSPDEDALPIHSGPGPGASHRTSVASGNTLFENRGQLYGTSPFPSDNSSGSDNLEIVTPGLRTKLAIMQVGSDRNHSNLLSVFAGLKNKSSHSLPLEVQTVYRDKSEHPLTTGHAGWVPITLKPHEETQYRSVAVSEDATDFMVRVRHAESDSSRP